MKPDVKKIIADIKATKGNRKFCNGLAGTLQDDNYASSICKYVKTVTPERIDLLIEYAEKLETEVTDMAVQLANAESKCRELAAENAYLLNGASRELNTSWMFHKTMLGAQAALVCLTHGYQAAAREWLEGTTDEAGAEIPDDISVGELHEWFESNMVSNGGNSGFLTRKEAEVAIRKECPATDAFLAEVRAQVWIEGSEPEEFGRYWVRYETDMGSQYCSAKWMEHNFCAGSNTNIHKIWLADHSRSINSLRGVTHYTKLPDSLEGAAK
ncbi:hypothetical protein E4179_13350 [Citrobacter freundii]|uniref:hypothetical protein n=1 Tax=Citrobacter freundii TaxID=546 RepID=UPI0012A85D0A|nr:hypothetical protein [Citrobacter freundii]QGJ41230.1 hypothetical protein E4179_13350 [Citrobacter freundii]